MVTKALPGRSGRTRAIVRLPRGMQRRPLCPVHVVARTVRRISRIVPSGKRCAEQYQQYADTYISGIPAIVFDVLR